MREIELFVRYKPILCGCTLFEDVHPELLPDALKFLRAQYRTCQRGESLVRLGEPFRYGVLLLSGTLEGSFITENYSKINMNHFSAGALIGESFACAQLTHSPVQLRAMTGCAVLLLDFSVLYDTGAVRHTYQLKISLNLMKALAAQNVALGNKIRIFSQKSLRDKVILFLESLPKRADGSVKLPFTRTAMAEYMGVNRSALSRELGRMEDAGLLQSVEDGYKLVL